MDNHFPGGVWPVMLTPFTPENKVDYPALAELTEWYLSQGAQGLFAVTQSSEMFYLTLEERVAVADFVRRQAAGRVPVIAAGHISDSLEAQAEEVRQIAGTGVDAVVLVTNRLARQEESDAVWIANLEKLLALLPDTIRLGLYECPYPYKRVMSEEMTRWCAGSGRFYFLKDTSCDIESIRRKLAICQGTNLKLYNANTATLLESLRLGAAGYSGVMANMQCSLYAYLCRKCGEEQQCDESKDADKADFALQGTGQEMDPQNRAAAHNADLDTLSARLTMCALIERQWYPTNAKYYLSLEGLSLTTVCRTQDHNGLTDTFRKEVKMLRSLTEEMKREYLSVQ